MIDILRRGANEAWELGLTEAQLAQFARYAELLVEWNATRLNLTRLCAPRRRRQAFSGLAGRAECGAHSPKRSRNSCRHGRGPAGPGPEDRPA